MGAIHHRTIPRFGTILPGHSVPPRLQLPSLVGVNLSENFLQEEGAALLAEVLCKGRRDMTHGRYGSAGCCRVRRKVWQKSFDKPCSLQTHVGLVIAVASQQRTQSFLRALSTQTDPFLIVSFVRSVAFEVPQSRLQCPENWSAVAPFAFQAPPLGLAWTCLPTTCGSLAPKALQG